jgi:hypothetical protein
MVHHLDHLARPPVRLTPPPPPRLHAHTRLISSHALVLELALPSKLIQWERESNVNKVSIRDGKSSINLASQGHCVGVFIGI